MEKELAVPAAPKATTTIPVVLERLHGNEVSYDLWSRLLKDSIIFVGGHEGEIDTYSANLLIGQLIYLAGQDTKKPIQLYINSPGGMVTAGLAIYDAMRFIKKEIITICMGMAMSFGAVLLAAGTKGRRYALPYSRIMIHQPLIMGGGISGQATDIKIEAAEMEKTKNILIKILAKHTGQTEEKVRQDMERNFYMSAEEAKEYGLIDGVIEEMPG